jgi:SSS family solute:Na+ symporter
MGYAFYPAMAFGTGFMALGMYLVGVPLREEGAVRGWISPVDAVRDRLGSEAAAKVFTFFLILFTLPYLALQPIAAGYLLETTLGVPYRWGALGVAALIAIYTARGGLKSLAKTDAFNGMLLFGIALAAWALVSRAVPASVGLPQAGTMKSMPPLELLGYYLLWFMADPMFPQLGQRFLAASGTRALERSATVYPLVTTSLFFLTIATGVLGATIVPGLKGAEADKVWLLAAAKAVGPAISGIFVLAPLAALVSTMDSQLLALASIVAKETRRPPERIFLLVYLIAGAGAGLALFPPQDILGFLNKTSFLGYAALFSTFFGIFYSKKASSAGALASMIAGETAVILSGMGLLTFRNVPAVFVVAGVSLFAWFVGNRIPSQGTKEPGYMGFLPRRLAASLPLGWALVFAALLASTIFAGVMEEGKVVFKGYPVWLLWSAGAGVLLSVCFAFFFRRRR